MGGFSPGGDWRMMTCVLLSRFEELVMVTVVETPLGWYVLYFGIGC